MLLRDLVGEIPYKTVTGDAGVEIRGITYDSRRVRPGDLFVCIQGLRDDGHRYAGDAVGRGAAALVVERDVDVSPEIPQVRVANGRSALAFLSRRIYGDPSSRLRVIGITGTNGKTTVSYLTEAILAEAGFRPGLLGTVEYRLGGRTIPSSRTTPDAADLQRMLHEMVEAGLTHAVMEVSSHALELQRVEGCEFDVAVLTNITQDHFDFHGTFERYLDSKAKLFVGMGKEARKTGPKLGVINRDDPSSQRIIDQTPMEVITYGFSTNAQVRLLSLCLGPSGSVIEVDLEGRKATVDLKLPGICNVYNAAAALAVGWREGIDPETMSRALSKVKGIKGRYEVIKLGQPFTVMVDYAHNPNGMENILMIARNRTFGRVIIVFGAEGGKDRPKRPMMGEVASRWADLSIITSDNPNFEDPAAIAGEIEQGFKKNGVPRGDREVILDRYRAIERAIAVARAGDCVVIAGKGHETQELFRGERFPYNDRRATEEILGRLGWGS